MIRGDVPVYRWVKDLTPSDPTRGTSRSMYAVTMGWGMPRRISKAINVVTYSGLDLTPLSPIEAMMPGAEAGQ